MRGKLRFLVALAALALLTGCFELHKRDEATIHGIAKTIERRESDYARWKAEMEKPDPSKRDVKSIQALQESELDRLRKWHEYESAKGD